MPSYQWMLNARVIAVKELLIPLQGLRAGLQAGAGNLQSPRSLKKNHHQQRKRIQPGCWPVRCLHVLLQRGVRRGEEQRAMCILGLYATGSEVLTIATKPVCPRTYCALDSSRCIRHDHDTWRMFAPPHAAAGDYDAQKVHAVCHLHLAVTTDWLCYTT